MSFFYDHIILIHHVHEEVESLPSQDHEKQELIDLIEETVHHHVINRILDKLHEDHHREFLSKFHSDPSDLEIIQHLKHHVPDIEYHIKAAADEIKYELLKTIREA